MEDQIANWPVKEPILTKEMMQAMEKFYRKIPISLTSATTFVACKNTVELVPTSQAFSFSTEGKEYSKTDYTTWKFLPDPSKTTRQPD